MRYYIEWNNNMVKRKNKRNDIMEQQNEKIEKRKKRNDMMLQ